MLIFRPQVLAKYHGDDDPNNAIVQLSFREMQEEISTTGSDKRPWDYSELISTKAARWRLVMVISMAFFGRKHISLYRVDPIRMLTTS